MAATTLLAEAFAALQGTDQAVLEVQTKLLHLFSDLGNLPTLAPQVWV